MKKYKKSLNPIDIIRKIEMCGFQFDILNETNGEIAHIRVNGFGDVWPSTGTFRRGRTWYKRKPGLLIKMLEEASEQKPRKITGKRASKVDLQKTVDEVTERLTLLEDELDQLKQRLGV